MKLLGLVGTNANFSYNRKLLWFMKDLFPFVEIEILEIAGLPLFSEDEPELPAGISAMTEQLMGADGLIIATPEYDHAVPAALKSVLEWLSWESSHPLKELPIMIVGASLGKLGTVYAQENLRTILQSPGLEAMVMPGHQFMLSEAKTAFDANGNLVDAKTIKFLESSFGAFVDFVSVMGPVRQELLSLDALAGASEE
ncbi:putative flavoprotein [Lactococcus termiticola]|uniref:Putative flavoprotein n=2 Tax=Lactococcus termiticola TaxID=2169526 RepID=A0A2R5HHR4_9LACT|nr:putative flavoprotein [Lactococcus termiticola]